MLRLLVPPMWRYVWRGKGQATFLFSFGEVHSADSTVTGSPTYTHTTRH